MKTLFLTLIVAAYAAGHYAPEFVSQWNDYKASSACIKQKVRMGIERGDIVVSGGTCFVARGEHE